MNFYRLTAAALVGAFLMCTWAYFVIGAGIEAGDIPAKGEEEALAIAACAGAVVGMLAESARQFLAQLRGD